MDDLAAFFPDPGPAPVAQARQNPGHKGVRFVHFPAWRAGRDSLRATFAASASVQCERLRSLLGFNDGQPQLDAEMEAAELSAPLRSPRLALPPKVPSRRAQRSRPRVRVARLSLSRASAQIWRTRSRVSSSDLPISSRVRSFSPSRPKRWVTT
jgi:hypothetical protein